MSSMRETLTWNTHEQKQVMILNRILFHLAEFAILTHVPLHRLPSALGSPQAVLHRFGLSP